MAASIATIATYLLEEGLKYSIHDNYIRISFAMRNYVDEENDQSLFLVSFIEEDGSYFKIMAPNLYHYPLDGSNSAELFRVLLAISWRNKLVKYAYDEKDGEVIALAEIPLEDTELGKKQLFRCLNSLIQVIDEYHPVISACLAGKEGSIELAEDKADNLRKAEHILQAAGISGHKRSQPARSLLRFEE
ncbi:hypothetical protein MASR2M29_22580 [Spirochaetota bacterium]